MWRQIVTVCCKFLTLLFLVGSWPVVVGAAANAPESYSIEREWLEPMMTLADAQHLLGRTGFGATPERLAQMLSLTRAEAIDNIVNGLRTSPDVPYPAWVNEPAPPFWQQRDMVPEQKQAFRDTRRAELINLRQWWVNTMLQTSSPQTERLVLFWHDHFATSFLGVDSRSISIARQNKLFRENAFSSYREFLKLLIRDPAMLRYLDNQTSRKGKPNENLARELLELFTLGDGNYTEATVKEAARALTGYGISPIYDESFRFYTNRHDSGNKTLFGQTGNFNGDALIDLILEQPAAAKYLVTRYWHAFVSDNAPHSGFVTDLAQDFRQSDYDLKQLYRSVLSSESFWKSENRMSIIKSPVALLIGTARSLDYPKRNWQQLAALLAQLGMDLFAPPNVSGWDEGVAFVTPGKLLNRQVALRSLVKPASQGARAKQNTMQNNMMSASNANKNTPLQVRVAGNSYLTVPRYRVKLLDDANNIIWTSKERRVALSYDTKLFGTMVNMDQLTWQDSPYNPPTALLDNARSVQVEFLDNRKRNSGKRSNAKKQNRPGRRNLFIESIRVHNTVFAAADAEQHSNCIPKAKRNTGNLYCPGVVTFDIAGKALSALERDDDYTASSATLFGSSVKQKQLGATIVLNNVQTPVGYFQNVSFQIISKNNTNLEVFVDSFGCVPDCVKGWPPCTALANDPHLQRVQLTLNGSGPKQRCVNEGLSIAERDLLHAIMNSVPDLVSYLEEHTAGNVALSKNMARWQERLTRLKPLLEKNANSKPVGAFALNENYIKPDVEHTNLDNPSINVTSLQAYKTLLDSADVTLSQMLIGSNASVMFDRRNEFNKTLKQQLDAVLAHPAYQVH